MKYSKRFGNSLVDVELDDKNEICVRVTYDFCYEYLKQSRPIWAGNLHQICLLGCNEAMAFIAESICSLLQAPAREPAATA